MNAFKTLHVLAKQTAQLDRMRWRRHFGLGLLKTRGPLLEVNPVRREAALRLRFQRSAEPCRAFWEFFVSLNGPASGRFNGEPNFAWKKPRGSGRTMRGIESI